MIYLHEHNSKSLRYNIADIPDGATVAAAHYVLKTAQDAQDEVLRIDVDLESAWEGSIENTPADHSAVVEFFVDLAGVSGLDADHYYAQQVQIVLSNSAKYMLPESLDFVRIRKGIN